jgi:hypothetical protein
LSKESAAEVRGHTEQFGEACVCVGWKGSCVASYLTPCPLPVPLQMSARLGVARHAVVQTPVAAPKGRPAGSPTVTSAKPAIVLGGRSTEPQNKRLRVSDPPVEPEPAPEKRECVLCWRLSDCETVRP